MNTSSGIALEVALEDAAVEAVVREFIRVWSAGNLEVLERVAAEGITVAYSHFPEPVEGRAAFRAVLEETFSHFPDLKTTVEAVLARGDEAAVEWSYTGTHEHGALFGIEPSGRRVHVAGMSFYRIADGKVVEERGVADVLGLMQQLGAFD